MTVYEPEDLPESKNGHRGKRGEQQLSDWPNHDVAAVCCYSDSGSDYLFASLARGDVRASFRSLPPMSPAQLDNFTPSDSNSPYTVPSYINSTLSTHVVQQHDNEQTRSRKQQLLWPCTYTVIRTVSHHFSVSMSNFIRLSSSMRTDDRIWYLTAEGCTESYITLQVPVTRPIRNCDLFNVYDNQHLLLLPLKPNIK